MFIRSNRIYMEDGCKSGVLEIKNGIIEKFLPDGGNSMTADVDCGNDMIIPGLFDTHNHGGFGVRVNEAATEGELKLYLKGLASAGVTAVFPTTAELGAMRMIAKMADEAQDGAKIMGIHSEGPWGARVGEKGVNTGYPKVDLEYAKKMVDACGGKLKLVGIAPEVEGAYDAIDFFLSNDIAMAMYHTNMNYEAACRAVDRGITVATHLCNVMTGLHHRDVGVMGAAILRSEVYCELICDYLHVCKEMIEIILRLKDNRKIMMISDCGSYAGAPVGKYLNAWHSDVSARNTIEVTEEGFVMSETGRLMGSSKPVMFGLKNLVKISGIPLENVWRLCSYNVFEKYGFVDRKGSIKPGKDADFTVINDNFDVLYTYSEGRLVYDHRVDTDIFNHKFVEQFKIA